MSQTDFQPSTTDTIFALASGAGMAGVAVVRISGAAAFEALASLSGKENPEPRMATLRELKHPKSKIRLDKALVLTFPCPASFTGEDVVELHLHGGRSVVAGVLEALAALPSLRIAEPGEFSRRAFEQGKLDLTEAEGLNDLIHAQTAAQREQALSQMDGGLKNLYEGWRAKLIGHLAHLEADIDFPDEDLPEGVSGAISPDMLRLREELTQYLVDGRRGQALRDGFRIVILGEPNAGKSTLLNALAKSDVAIVSEEKGTTRDTIEVSLDLHGYPVRLIDTAGLREVENTVEKEGVRRAKAKAEDADLRLILVRADEWPSLPEAATEWLDDTSILAISQTDRVEMFHVEHPKSSLDELGLAKNIVTISAHNDHGMDDLLALLEQCVENAMAPREVPSLTRLRHREALEATVGHLHRFEDNASLDAVLAAEDVRMAARSLGKITGRVSVEDMLDVVFSDFCIGK
ncbi:MAG: tRNA uridine-5-carboxymethylaminomethyl(34) synthesis GTPase MnmE [Kordiimonadaceae bacterium]|nr:tRNA uridine-5-carboxymethylaminomethyl(34) synthesis GTPase MnmE [Kordiimonadaceae bacterium]